MKNRLRALRIERRWSQAVLAHAAGVSQQTIQSVETGKFNPSLPLAFTFARILQMRIEDIFDPDEDSRMRKRPILMREGLQMRHP